MCDTSNFGPAAVYADIDAANAVRSTLSSSATVSAVVDPAPRHGTCYAIASIGYACTN